MATQVHYIVNKLSPNIYAAAQQANLPKGQASQLEQLGWTVDKNRNLMKLPKEEGRKEFASLAPEVQEKIKFLYPDAEYTKDPETLGDKFVGALGLAAKTAASPLLGIFKVMGAYNRAINTPYLVGRQVAQGKDLFSIKTLQDAWDGRRVYDEGALTEATSVFGEAEVKVAQGLIAGLKPGQIVEQYGEVDQSLLKALQKAYNDPDAFKQVLDGVKYAQVSLGRDVARMFDTKPTKANLHQDYIDGRTKNISGYIDFAYQLVIDPLTYVSGGLSKLPMLGNKFMSRGDRIAQTITERGTAGVREVFRNEPGVAKLWDEGIGKAVKKIADAPTTAEKTRARRELGARYAGYNNDEAIDMLVRNEIFDAKAAVNYFSQVENVPLLLAGRVDGIQYFRNGVATARNQRRLGEGFSKYVDSFFNPAKSTDEIEKGGKDAWDILTKVGTDENKLVPEEITEVKKFWNQMSKREKIAQKFGRSTQSRYIMTGEDSLKTADVVRDTFRQIAPRDIADFLTYKFVNADANDQIIILRNTYYAIMQKYGLDGHPKGKELIEKTLQSKFGDKEGLSVVSKLEVNPKFAGEVGEVGLKRHDSGLEYETSGIIHPFQEAKGIASLDFMEIAETVANIKSKKNLIMAAGGATQSHTASEFVNAWSLLTLFPRLGIRSGIDEGMMFLLTAPGADIFRYATRKGHKLGKIATAHTGSKAAEGLRSSLAGVVGTRTSDLLSIEQRLHIRKELAEKRGISEDLLSKIDVGTETAREAVRLFNNVDPQDAEYLVEGLAHGAHILSSSARSMAGSASLTGRQSNEVVESLIDMNNYDLMLKDLDVVSGKTGNVVSTYDLDKASILDGQGVAVVHFENFIERFYGNKKALKGTKGSRTFDPSRNFLDNNALETTADFRKAKEEALAAIGVEPNTDLWRAVGAENVDSISKNVAWVIKDVDAVNEFLKMSSRSSELMQRGVPRAEIVADQVDRILLDLYTTFHGSSSNFNAGLYELVKSRHKNLTDAEIAMVTTVPDKFRRAIKSLTFEDFQKATKGYQPKGRMYTQLNIEGLTDMESVYAKLGNDAFGFMDRQVTEMFRQPAVMIAYTRIRKNLSKLQKEEEAVTLARFIQQNGGTGRRSLDSLKEDIKEQVTRKYVEISINQATDTVLKYADNPLIRTNFALSIRNTGRFYRATEDFWRRTYRLKDVAPRVLYRMRLAHIGLNSAGMIYSDAKGDPYVMMPMDDIIFKTVDGTVRALTGNDGAFQQPMFNDFTLKLKLANPSFSPDAGVPTLSGPIAALGVLGMKSILGRTGTTGEKAAEELDSIALGNIGEGMDITRALVPASIQKVWKILDSNEKNKQEATAAMQAIAYNASQGIMLKPDATEEEKYEYLKNIRISAHNIIALKSALGLFSPIAPSIQESVGVPDYLKEVGIVTLRAEFFDLVDAVTKKYNGDVQDPYELALSTFMGKYPGKLVYTISRDEKTTKVQIQKTKELKDWAISNKETINKYGQAAFILAPRVGEFDAGTYAWLEAADLLQDKTVERYFVDVMVGKDKQAYYNIARDEKKQLSQTVSSTARKSIIEASTARRKMLKASNPLLEASLSAGGNEIATEQQMLNSLEEMLANTNIKVSNGTRSKLLILTNQVRSFINLSEDPAARNTENFVQVKRDRKLAIEQMIAELATQDLSVKEANRAIFSAILDYYSRDSYTS